MTTAICFWVQLPSRFHFLLWAEVLFGTELAQFAIFDVDTFGVEINWKDLSSRNSDKSQQTVDYDIRL